MKTLVIFYSYTGKTKKYAEELAAKEAAKLCEIKDTRRPGKLKAYTAGCFASLRGKPWKIQPLSMNLADYDRLILLAPVWAGNPTPAINLYLRCCRRVKPCRSKWFRQAEKASVKNGLKR